MSGTMFSEEISELKRIRNRAKKNHEASSELITALSEFADGWSETPTEEPAPPLPPPEPEPPMPPEPPGEGAVVLRPESGLDHVYSQLNVWNDSMTEVLLKTTKYRYKVFSWPDLEFVRDVEGGGVRWLDDDLLSMDEKNIWRDSVDGRQIIATVPDEHSIWIGASHEEESGVAGATPAGGKKVIVIDDDRRTYFIVNLETGAMEMRELTLEEQSAGINTMVMFPSGEHFLAVFDGVGRKRGDGMHLYSRINGEFVHVRQMAQHHHHFDVGIDSKGREFLVTEEWYLPNRSEETSIVKHFINMDPMEVVADLPWNHWHVSAQARGIDRICITDSDNCFVVDGMSNERFELSPHGGGGQGYDLQPQGSISPDGNWVCFDDEDGAVFERVR